MPRTRLTSPRGPLLRVSLTHRGGGLSLSSAEVRRIVGRALRAEGRPRGDVGLIVTDDAELANLHAQFFGDPSPTDVITFPRSPPKSPEVIGEIVISGESARREAGHRGHTGREEALLYVVHGVLHLCGYRDDTPSEFERMHDREDALLSALGLGPIFAGRPPNLAASPTRSAEFRH